MAFTNQTKNTATYSNASKSSSTFANVSKGISATYFELLIDGTYSFLIESPYTLLIGDSASAGASWSNTAKN